MKKSTLARIFAAFIASASIFTFAACDTQTPEGSGSGGGTGTEESGTGEQKPSGSGSGGTGEQKPGTGDGGEEKDPNTGGGVVKPEEPVIPTVPAGAVKITKAAGDLEAAYAIWDKVDGAMSYNVYYKIDGGEFVKLDAPLVREYKDYCRADAVGLKAGKYTLKVVPTGGAEYTEDNDKAATATEITVLAHERAGYAFVGGTASGAYNEDGTLKADAQVLYITDANKDTVTMNGATGLQNILNTQKKSGKPLAVRLIGNITSPDVSTSTEKVNPNSLLIKGNTDKVNMQTTLEGIGSDATANGWTLRITSSKNVEIRNIGFMNTHASEPDDITLEKDTHVWVHNCDLFYGGAGGDSDQAKGDGALDTKESTYITHSYNHFWDSGKCNLQNMHESGDWRITYHHNWYDHSDSRHPRIRSATVHVYNNYFDGNAKYGVGACEGSSVFVENNYFRSTATIKPMMSSMQGTDLAHLTGSKGTFSGEDGGMIKAFGNYFDGKKELITQNDTADKTDLDCYLATSRNETVSSEYKAKKGGSTYNNFDTASDFYEYEVDTAEVAKQKVELYAGRVDGGDFKWEFDDATEDSNSSIITALKTALGAYTSDLVKAGGEAVSGGTTPGGSESGGENGGDEGNTTVEGEISFIPTSSGSGFNVEGTTYSNSAMTIAGVSIPKGASLKLNSSGKITFTTTAKMTMYLYVRNSSTVKVDDTPQTPKAEGDYYVITLTIDAGNHTIAKGSGESAVYLIRLIPET